MLVLRRKVGQEIVIDNDIRITVVAVRGGQVRLGFTAPPDVAIRRDEVCRAHQSRAPLPCEQEAAVVSALVWRLAQAAGIARAQLPVDVGKMA